MLLVVLNNKVLAYFLINCRLLREGFCDRQTVSITNFVVVSSVGIMRVDCNDQPSYLHSLVRALVV